MHNHNMLVYEGIHSFRSACRLVVLRKNDDGDGVSWASASLTQGLPLPAVPHHVDAVGRLLGSDRGPHAILTH